MIELKVEKEGLQELVLGLKNFGRDISLLEEPLNDSARYMQQQAIANFATSGALMQEGGWPPLKETTVKLKAKRYPGAPMMVRSGTLKRSFEIIGPKIGKDIGEIEVRNPVEYASYHQFSMNEARLPRRILLRFQKQQVQDITNIFARWIDKITNKNFK